MRSKLPPLFRNAVSTWNLQEIGKSTESSSENEMITFNLFISHSWAYSDAYRNLLKLLERTPCFRLRNYSVSRDAPVSANGSARRLYRAIFRRMRLCSVILVPTGFTRATENRRTRETTPMRPSGGTRKASSRR